MRGFAVGQVVKIIDSESPYYGYLGMIKQVNLIDFGIQSKAAQYVVELSNWPDGYPPINEFTETPFKVVFLLGC